MSAHKELFLAFFNTFVPDNLTPNSILQREAVPMLDNKHAFLSLATPATSLASTNGGCHCAPAMPLFVQLEIW